MLLSRFVLLRIGEEDFVNSEAFKFVGRHLRSHCPVQLDRPQQAVLHDFEHPVRLRGEGFVEI